jgi:cell filamentation protein
MPQNDGASRYAATGGSENEYMDDAETVLRNKKGIADLQTLYVEEEKGLARAYEQLLAEVRSDTPITAELIRYAHGAIFDDLYDWAGRWRRVTISKPGVTWPPPDYLEEAMKDFEVTLLKKYPVHALISDDAFCQALGHIQGEFLAIHPFREGNARTIKLVTDMLSLQTGRLPLVYDDTDTGKERYIAAAKAAMLQDYEPMAAVIRTALIISKSSSSL